MSTFFDVKKQRPKTDLEKCYQCSVSTENSLNLKVFFTLVTYKINNLIALRSTTQITEISASCDQKSIRKSAKSTKIISKKLSKIYQKYPCIESQCYVFVERLPVPPTLPYIQNGLQIICSFILGLLRYSLCNLIKYSISTFNDYNLDKLINYVLVFRL